LPRLALQMVTVRYVDGFVPDPLAGVPTEVVDYLAATRTPAHHSCGLPSR
jgi:hypothetical protein